MQTATDIGCFGSPMAYDGACVACQSCPHFGSCQDAAAKRTERLSEKLDMRALIARQRRFYQGVIRDHGGTQRTMLRPTWNVQSERVPAWAEGLPVKARAMSQRLTQLKIDLHESLAAGQNPFRGLQPKYMEVACDMLIAGGFTRKELARRFTEEFSTWNPRSTSTNVSNVTALLLGSGAAREDGGHIVRNVQ